MVLMPKNWILVRGLARETRHWGDFPPMMKEKFPDTQIHVLELPGVGKKVNVSAFNHISQYADHLREEWLQLKEGSTGDWGLLSISLGAMISMNWCSRYQYDFKALVMINSSGGNLSPITQRFSPQTMKLVLKLFFREDYYEREKAIIELTTRKKTVSDEMIHKYAEYSQENPIKRSNFLKQMYAASQFKVPSHLSLPLLILASRHDALASYHCSETMAKHFGVPFYLNEEAGHDLPLDDPEWILEQLQLFFQG